MKESSYRERDHAFGQLMLTLRSTIGLTQIGLANYLGVSRHAVGDWEAGSSYPKPVHLKQFIALAVEHHAFPDGRVADEVRGLWHAAHQKVLLDQAWLATLLLPSQKASKPAEKPSGNRYAPRLDWGDALAIPNFCGRESELNLLGQWVVAERCRVVSVLGLGGIGKSALAVSLMHRVAEHFQVVIWRSLRDLPMFEVLLDDLLQVLAPQTLSQLPASFEQQQSLLLEQMRRTRVLFVLDNFESVLEEGQEDGRMRPGYEGLGRLLRLSAETEHQSCLVLTSREKPGDLAPLEGSRSPVRALRLARLEAEACEALLAEKDLKGSGPERALLIEMYTGNPLALKIVGQTILELYDGKIATFLEQGEIIVGGVRQLLDHQFNRLSHLEQCVLLWLTILREPATLDELLARLVTPMPRHRLLEAVEALYRRSLIERGRPRASFTVQSVVLEYTTARLIAEAAGEIEHGQLARLIEHGLELATVKEYVRQVQQRLLVAPLLAQLRSQYSERRGVEAQLLALLDQLRTRADHAQGYGPANLLALLRLERGHLRSLTLSQLAIRGAYLQEVEMQDASLAEASLRETVFDEAFDTTCGLAIGGNGEYWAASSRRGQVRVWCEGGKLLHRAWQAHTDTVQALAFNPDGHTLATGSLDGSIKLWDIESGTLLWTSWITENVECLAFAPDGRTLASGGDDATVQLWNARTGAHLRTLSSTSGPVLAVAWSLDGQLLASGGVDGDIRLWDLQGAPSKPSVRLLEGHSNWVSGLAFAPDGRTLASASWDCTIKLWDVASGCVGQTLSGHTVRVRGVAWSPDGHLLASCGFDPTIWLWDIERSGYRMGLQGHTAGVHAIAFTPDGRSLLSGSEDGTLRVWDVERRQCAQILQGYAVALYDVAWSPAGPLLATAGSNRLVSIWEREGLAPPRLLRGHRSLVFGVAWSPDGRFLASSGLDNAIRLWDAVTGEEKQTLQDPDHADTLFYDVAWSPDGRCLAASTYYRGIHVWEVSMHRRRWVSATQSTRIRRIAWSPNGTQLASCGDDGSVRLWKATDGTVRALSRGHHGVAMTVAWSPDGTLLVSGGGGREGGELVVWDAERGTYLRTLRGHSAIVHAVAWGPGQELLVSGSSDGQLRWWDMQSGECLQVRHAHRGTVHSLRTSPDGNILASCGADGAIMLWGARRGEYLQTLRQDRPYERLNIAGIKGLSETQKETLRALGAIEKVTPPL